MSHNDIEDLPKNDTGERGENGVQNKPLELLIRKFRNELSIPTMLVFRAFRAEIRAVAALTSFLVAQILSARSTGFLDFRLVHRSSPASTPV